MKTVHFLVKDMNYTGLIATSIRKYLGDRVVCHENFAPEGVKIDVFILSGTVILASPRQMVAEIKAHLGSENSKAVAISALNEILDSIDGDPGLSVDYTIWNGELLSGFDYPVRGRRGGTKKFLEEVVASFA